MEDQNPNLNYATKCLKKINDDNLRINLQQGNSANPEIKWLRYKINLTRISPLETKTADISGNSSIKYPQPINFISWISSLYWENHTKSGKTFLRLKIIAEKV